MANVRVRWVDSLSAAATGNKIYREDVEIADIANGIQEYIDTSAPDGATGLKYEVQAHDGAGDETTQEVEGENMDYIDTSSALTESLVAYWRFNDTQVDEVGGYTGSGTGLTYVAGKSGNALNVDGSAQAGSVVPNESTFSFGNGTEDQPFSISCYVKFDSVTSGLDGWLFTKRTDNSGPNTEYQLGIIGGELFLTLYSQGTGTQIYKLYSIWGDLTSGQWHYIVATYDGSKTAAGINLYLDNGASLGTATEDPAYVAMNTTASALKIGGVGYSSLNALIGAIDGLGLWDIELDAAQRTEIYDIQAAGNELL